MTWPLSDAGLCAQGGSIGATSLLTTLTASATPHTAGSWVQLIASTPWAADSVMLHVGTLTTASGTDTSTLVDVGIGGSGSEIVLVESIPIGFLAVLTAHVLLPRRIPAGSRLSARIRSVQASKTTTAQLRLVGGGLNGAPGFGRATTYGADTANSSGTALTAPGATNTKAAWTEITASTTSAMRAMLVGITSRPNATWTAKTCLFDIGYGGSGSEQVVIPDIPASFSLVEVCAAPFVCVPVSIPEGSRLVARYAATSTADAPAVVIVGFD